MNEEVKFYLDDAKENMLSAVNHLSKELSNIHAGKATPTMLDGVTVDYYGTETPLAQVANINTPDARTIAIQPWEKSIISLIEKAILKANLGFNPANNGELIRISVPMLTEERRKQLVKQVKTEGENAKISVRNARRDSNDEIKKLKDNNVSEDEIKDGEAEVQKATDKYIKEVDALVDSKEKDIMTI